MESSVAKMLVLSALTCARPKIRAGRTVQQSNGDDDLVLYPMDLSLYQGLDLQFLARQGWIGIGAKNGADGGGRADA